MAKDGNEYALWYMALNGKKIDYPADQPPSGRWRTKGGDLVATWRDENGKIFAWTSRAIHGHGQKLEGGHSIGETFSEAFSYPVPYKLWDEVKNGNPWPPEYRTRLTVKEAQAGTMWTVELGRARAGQDVEPEEALEGSRPVQVKTEGVQFSQPQPDNPRAVIGDNKPPEDLTPDQMLADRVRNVSANFKAFLAKIGGKIKTKAEADTAANFATKLGEFASKAKSEHELEKAPHWAKCKEIDAKWLPTAKTAESERAVILKHAAIWADAERAAREEDARKANEIARQSALKEAQITGEPVDRVAEVKAEAVTFGTAKVVSVRAKTIWLVQDAQAYLSYLSLKCPEAHKEVVAAMQKIANRQKSVAVSPIPNGLVEKEVETLR